MNARTPFNPAAHDFFVAAGYVVTHYKADFEDVGDAESGPKLSGGPAFDEYAADDHCVIVTEGGATFLETEEGRQEEAPMLIRLTPTATSPI